jgi:hypothetical protein
MLSLRAVLFLAILAVTYAALDANQITTFGGMISQGSLEQGKEAVIFERDCNSPQQCMMTYFWYTCAYSNFENTVFRYYIDGEKNASIAGTFFMLHGIGFSSHDGPTWGHSVIGKGANQGGVYNTYRIPFGKHVRVTAQLPEKSSGPKVYWVIFRGIEGSSQVTIGKDLIQLPPQARLKLYTNEGVTLKPLQFVDLSNSPANGALFQVTLAVESGNLNYLEGCFRAFIDNGNTKMLLSSGTEDYYQSAFYFDGGKFHFPEAGLTYFNNNTFAAYKFHQDDPIIFHKGLRLVWRNGDTNDPATGQKCINDQGPPNGNPQQSKVTTYTWVYEW